MQENNTAQVKTASPAKTRPPVKNPGQKRKPAGQNRKQNQNRNRKPSRPPRRPTRTVKQPSKPVKNIEQETIRIIPLGGVEEVGKNMTAIEFGNDIIVIDIGLQFPGEDTPGVDYIVPDTTYLEERKDKIRGIVITHGHLDHIGGIPYVINRLGNPPIYTREFGAMLIKKRHEEFFHLPPVNIKVVKKDDGPIRLGENLKVLFFGLTHSIPDSTGVIIETPFGDIISTGDVRVDNENGVPSQKEVDQYKLFKDRNVLLLTMDSTGVEKPGWSVSEDVVIQNIDRIVSGLPGRVIIATFSSQVERIIKFLDIARKHNRKVVVEGRSMKGNVEIIRHLELAKLDHVIPSDEMESYPPNQIFILATGAQGEEFAALMRMSMKAHKQVKLNETDTIILSSSVIPGNATSVAKLKDNLYRTNARIITYYEEEVHASGHGKRAELEWIHTQIPYKYFMPIHGHHYMLKMHAELSKSLGTPANNIIVPDNGSVIEISDKGNKIEMLKESASNKVVMVDAIGGNSVEEVVIRDRQLLSQDGIFVIIATIDLKTGKVLKSPDIISRGFVYLKESQDMLRHVRFQVKKTIEDTTSKMHPINFDYVKNTLREEIGRYLLQKTHKRPIILPVLIEV